MMRYRSFKLSIFWCLVNVLAFFTCAHASESYTSKGYTFPEVFSNNMYDMLHNDLEDISVVNYQNNEFVFFTLFKKDSAGVFVDDSKYLYYYVPQLDLHGDIDIGNKYPPGVDYSLKACVFNDDLFIFYTPNYPAGQQNKLIYYRTITWAFDSNQQKNILSISDEKTLTPGGAAITLQLADVMSDEMYLIYTDSATGSWYYLKTADGMHFTGGTQFHSLPTGTLYGVGGTVFQVPDEENGCIDKMMIAFSIRTSGYQNLWYFIFNGATATADQSLQYTSGLTADSIKLAAGTAQGYTNDHYAVQAWITSQQKSEYWYFYHAEYIPAGAQGEEGTWSAWTRLSASGDDTLKLSGYSGHNNQPTRGWTVIPFFTSIPSPTVPGQQDLKMEQHLWYSRGTHYTWPSQDHVKLRVSAYESDYLQFVDLTTVDSTEQGTDMATILGVIEGTPPFPLNGGLPPDPDSAETSLVDLGVDQTNTTETKIAVGNTMVANFGGKFGKVGVNIKLSHAFTYAYGSGFKDERSKEREFHSYADEPPGDLGWVVALVPEIDNYHYLLKSYSISDLIYGTDPPGQDTFAVSLIQYGPNTQIKYYPYELENPTEGFTHSPWFEGMESRALDTDIDYWADLTHNRTLSVPTGYVMNKLPTLSGSAGTTSYGELVKETSDADTYAPRASFQTSAKSLGWQVSDKVSLSFKITTQTTFSGHLRFAYNLPNCGEEGGYAMVDVTPVLLQPSDDNSGYQCPWISDDIRSFKKPKPWCLSYLVYPGSQCTTALSEFRLDDIRAFLWIDWARPDHDSFKVNAKMSYVPMAFAFAEDTPIQIALGNYIIDSTSDTVVYKEAGEDSLILQLAPVSSPGAVIRVSAVIDREAATLNIGIDGWQLDLSQLSTYGLGNMTTQQGGDHIIVPFTFRAKETGNFASGAVGILYHSLVDRKGIGRSYAIFSE